VHLTWITKKITDLRNSYKLKTIQASYKQNIRSLIWSLKKRTKFSQKQLEAFASDYKDVNSQEVGLTIDQFLTLFPAHVPWWPKNLLEPMFGYFFTRSQDASFSSYVLCLDKLLNQDFGFFQQVAFGLTTTNKEMDASLFKVGTHLLFRIWTRSSQADEQAFERLWKEIGSDIQLLDLEMFVEKTKPVGAIQIP